MSDAKTFREKAQLFSNAANMASNERVRVTLLRWARSALQTAAEMEGKKYRESPPAKADSDE